ncbi:hypothetical protein CW362_31410 [Streptomyces populi]|uniref:DNA-binding protein n=1 Tax=Streptomyces populi TaxID=2058924 RepID=A0A2I0SGN7_9ACTN|nr:hypothetical protein [Streptomyces populi]PKT69098.1 hypothetical protein CW362_31410 [Streptomyces populi]
MLVWRVEAGGYWGGLDEDLEFVSWRNPRGRVLKQLPAALEGHPELGRMRRLRRWIEQHASECAELARQWAGAGIEVPAELAESDPVWKDALTEAGVPIAEGPASDTGAVARIYEHVVTGRRIVRVMPEEVAPYRDKVMAYEEWERVGGFRTGVPGTGEDARPRELPFPERALAAFPGQEDAVLEEAERLWATGLWKKDTDLFFKELERSRPEMLPLFLDEAAQRYLAGGYDHHRDGGAAYFGRARKAEREQALAMDQDWLDARYAVFAEAGAIAVSALRARARELSRGGAITPERAVAFRTVVIKWVAATAAAARGGPYAQLALDVRNVAKAAGLDPEEELAEVLGQARMVPRRLPDDGLFWPDALAGRAFDVLCEREPESVRADLLRQRPCAGERENRLWLDMLERSGTLARLCGELPGVTAAEASRWLTDCLYEGRGFRPDRAFFGIAARIAPRLAAERVRVEIRYEPGRPGDRMILPLDLIDLFLEHGVPLPDPPERLLPTQLKDLTVANRPEMRHVWADPRFGPEARALLHDELHRTSGRYSDHGRWYASLSTWEWTEPHPSFAHGEGLAVLREWCAHERTTLRSGIGLADLALLLGRLVHVGGTVDALLKDAGAAAELAAVDVIGPLMSELPALPEGTGRADVEKLIAGLPADAVRIRPESVVMDAVARLWPDMEVVAPRWPDKPLDAWQVGNTLQTAVNCRVALERLVRRFTPEGAVTPVDTAAVVSTTATEAPEPPRTGLALVCDRLIELAGSRPPAGTGEDDSRTPDIPVGRGPDRLLLLHAFTARTTLAHSVAAHPHSVPDGRDYADYARLPFVAETERAGHWRIVRITRTDDYVRLPHNGQTFRTATSAAAVIDSGPWTRDLLEYAPEGDFPEDGPLTAAGIRTLHTEVLRPVRPASWYTRLAELLREHRGVPARPELAAPFAERLGIQPPEAAFLLAGQLTCAPHQVRRPMTGRAPGGRLPGPEWGLDPAETRAALEGLRALLAPGDLGTLYERLLPDDPDRLWTEGPDIERAAAWWRERFGAPRPAPAALLPLARKEFPRLKGELAYPSRDARAAEPWRPHLRVATLLGRVASGGKVLDGIRTGGGEPGWIGETGDARSCPVGADLLGLVRAAAWTAYRTQAGDPLRPAVGAAVARLRAALDAGTGPLTVFSTQSNHLMKGPAPLSSQGLDTHPAVSWQDDPVYAVRHIRVDPAALTGPDDPVLDRLDAYFDAVLPSQWLPTLSGLPGLADLRALLSPDLAALGAHLAADEGRAAGWEQDPARGVPHLVEECASAYGLGTDAAVLYLTLLALPDPTDRNVKQWTGWKPARFKAAHTELAASGRVLSTTRARAGRTLFLPGPWQETKAPRLPLERAKFSSTPYAREHRSTAHTAVVPCAPVPVLFERAWAQRA